MDENLDDGGGRSELSLPSKRRRDRLALDARDVRAHHLLDVRTLADRPLHVQPRLAKHTSKKYVCGGVSLPAVTQICEHPSRTGFSFPLPHCCFLSSTYCSSLRSQPSLSASPAYLSPFLSSSFSPPSPPSVSSLSRRSLRVYRDPSPA